MSASAGQSSRRYTNATALGSTLIGVEDSWEVLDVPQAVAAQGQAGAGEAQAIILQIQRHMVMILVRGESAAHRLDIDAPALRQDGEFERLWARGGAEIGGSPPHRRRTSYGRASGGRHRGR